MLKPALLIASAPLPIAVFPSWLMLLESAAKPMAVLLKPPVLLKSA